MSSRAARRTEAQESPASPSPLAASSRRPASRRSGATQSSRRSGSSRSRSRRAEAATSSASSESGASSPPRDRELRVSATSRANGAAGRTYNVSAGTSSLRARREPTPTASGMRRNSNRLNDFSVADGLDPEMADLAVGRNRQLDSQDAPISSYRGGNTCLNRQRRARGHHQGRHEAATLYWYERLMPEFLLRMTSPLTGYETALDHIEEELNDEELELLERQRFRRNRRIRRRVLTVCLVAGLASAYFIYRGRGSNGSFLGFRRSPVRGTIGEMAHRVEEGLSKTIHDTMGK